MSNIRPELFQKPTQSFRDHLSIKENNRILFSGRFGIGKTTFLNHYFKENKDKYNVIHLFPVNYSVLENEDIFSYIKYDILTDLMANNEYPLKADYYSFLKTWDSFLLKNLDQVIATTMLLIPKFGKQLNQFTKDLKQMAKDFEEYKKTTKEKELDAVAKFLQKIHEAEGGIYESNIITLIIQNWLKDIKGEKENVLIIDDLDRIDPNHIFRLLNVFSAHFDNRDNDESKNKFGFDKVIFVCDIDNIRSIYESQYGVKTDFNGYVDKFYSKEVYRFDNKENVKGILRNLALTLEVGLSDRDHFLSFPNNHLFRTYLHIVLLTLVDENKINLRSIFKHARSKIDIRGKQVEFSGQKFNVKDNQLLIAIHVLSVFLGHVGVYGEQNCLSSALFVIPRQSNEFCKELLSNLLVFSNTDRIIRNDVGNLLYSTGLSFTDKNNNTFKYNLTEDNLGNTLSAELTSIMSNNKGHIREVSKMNSFFTSYNFAELFSVVLENLSD